MNNSYISVDQRVFHYQRKSAVLRSKTNMIKVTGRDFWRGGEKIGYLEAEYLYSREGRKLGSVQGNRVFDVSGNKLAWLEGDYVRMANGKSVRIEDNHAHVSGGELSDIERAAVRILLGD